MSKMLDYVSISLRGDRLLVVLDRTIDFQTSTFKKEGVSGIIEQEDGEKLILQDILANGQKPFVCSLTSGLGFDIYSPRDLTYIVSADKFLDDLVESIYYTPHITKKLKFGIFSMLMLKTHNLSEEALLTFSEILGTLSNQELDALTKSIFANILSDSQKQILGILGFESRLNLNSSDETSSHIEDLTPIESMVLSVLRLSESLDISEEDSLSSPLLKNLKNAGQ